MARDQALLKNAEVDLERQRVLFSQDSTSKQQLDTQEALVRQYQAALKIDQGQIDSAKLQLTYCQHYCADQRATRTAPGRSRQYCACLRRQRDCRHHADGSHQRDLHSSGRQSAAGDGSRLRDGHKLPVDAYDRDLKHKLAAGSLHDDR